MPIVHTNEHTVHCQFTKSTGLRVTFTCKCPWTSFEWYLYIWKLPAPLNPTFNWLSIPLPNNQSIQRLPLIVSCAQSIHTFLFKPWESIHKPGAWTIYAPKDEILWCLFIIVGKLNGVWNALLIVDYLPTINYVQRDGKNCSTLHLSATKEG